MSETNKSLLFNVEARKEILAGVNLLADAVKVTMGPSGQNVVIERPGAPPVLTKDGVTVAKSINLRDQFKNLGAQMVKEAASRSAETAGDGTTTATVLTQAIFSEGLKLLAAGYSSAEIRAGMEWASRETIAHLREMAKTVTSTDEIVSVGTISANGDQSIGRMLADAMHAVGRDGIISIEEAKGFDTSLDVVEGLELDRGYISPYFVTNHNRSVCELENPFILLVNKTISNISDVVPLLEAIHRQNRPLLIVADEVDGDALKTMIVNHLKGVLKVCIIRPPEFGQSRVEAFEDLALVFGCRVISAAEDMPTKSDKLGTCKRVEVYRNRTIFVGVNTETPLVKERVESIRSQLQSPGLSREEQELSHRRLARLSGGIAVLRVGGSTELEMRERKDRVEDALHATQAAVEEGLLPGGGVALVRASDRIRARIPAEATRDFISGADVINRACRAPLMQIVQNSGKQSAEVVLNKVLELPSGQGYDARAGRFVDMMTSGIIDPLKVVRCALENSTSAAISLLSVGCAIVEDNCENEKVETLI
jgi:chaperonin GroEL